LRNYPDWLEAFTEYASIGEAPLKFYFWTGVATIASVMRRQVMMQMGHFVWVPNFYIVLVAPPGIVNKSTTINIGKDLLSEIKGIRIGADALTWQFLIFDLASSTAMFEHNGIMTPQSAVSYFVSELGTFLNPQDRDLVDILTSIWGGDSKSSAFKKGTKTQGSDMIENPCINIIAGTTPSWFSENVPTSMVGGGLTARCIIIYADTKRQLVAYPGEHLPPHFHEQRTKLLEDLQTMASLGGNFIIEPDARDWGVDWYQKICSSYGSAHDRYFEVYLARKQTHLHKLAMIISLSRRDSLVITLNDMRFALGMLEGAEEDMNKIFAHVGQNENARVQTRFLEIMQSHKRISRQTVVRELSRLFAYRDIEDAIIGSVNAGLVITLVQGSDVILIDRRTIQGNVSNEN